MDRLDKLAFCRVIRECWVVTIKDVYMLPEKKQAACLVSELVIYEEAFAMTLKLNLQTSFLTGYLSDTGRIDCCGFNTRN